MMMTCGPEGADRHVTRRQNPWLTRYLACYVNQSMSFPAATACVVVSRGEVRVREKYPQAGTGRIVIPLNEAAQALWVRDSCKKLVPRSETQATEASKMATPGCNTLCMCGEGVQVPNTLSPNQWRCGNVVDWLHLARTTQVGPSSINVTCGKWDLTTYLTPKMGFGCIMNGRHWSPGIT